MNKYIHLKKLTIIACILVVLSFSRNAASAEPFQAGLVLGSATGISATWWLTETRGLKTALGIEYMRMFHLTHIWKFTTFPEQVEYLNTYFDFFYLGAGASAKSGSNDRVGFRAPIGLCNDLTIFNYPVSANIELAPLLRLSPDFGINGEVLATLEYRFK